MLSYPIFIKAIKLRSSLENPQFHEIKLPDYRYDSANNRFEDPNTGEYFLAEHTKINYPDGRTIDAIFVGKKLEEKVEPVDSGFTKTVATLASMDKLSDVNEKKENKSSEDYCPSCKGKCIRDELIEDGYYPC